MKKIIQLLAIIFIALPGLGQTASLPVNSDSELKNGIVYDHVKCEVNLYGKVTAAELIEELSTIEYAPVQNYSIKPTFPVPFMTPAYTSGYFIIGFSTLELWGEMIVSDFLLEVQKFDFDTENALMKPTYK
ncbi:MAG: hypothetical protein R2764_01510 [Bacteroidales bacterium]